MFHRDLTLKRIYKLFLFQPENLNSPLSLAHVMKKIFALLLLLFFIGCTQPTEDINNSENNTSSMETNVLVETSKGNFTISLYEDTPITTANFAKLVNEGFYDGLTFHRYEPGFVIQGGDPNGDGTGGSDATISLEVVGKSHSRGTLGMARSSDPNSASSQFFVNLADNIFLDEGYAVFGEVTEGMDIVDSLRAEDRIIRITIRS